MKFTDREGHFQLQESLVGIHYYGIEIEGAKNYQQWSSVQHHDNTMPIDIQNEQEVQEDMEQENICTLYEASQFHTYSLETCSTGRVHFGETKKCTVTQLPACTTKNKKKISVVERSASSTKNFL